MIGRGHLVRAIITSALAVVVGFILYVMGYSRLSGILILLGAVLASVVTLTVQHYRRKLRSQPRPATPLTEKQRENLKRLS